LIQKVQFTKPIRTEEQFVERIKYSVRQLIEIKEQVQKALRRLRRKEWEGHRRRREKFGNQFGPDHRSDLDLVSPNPDGSPLRPDSISSAVSLLSRRLKLPKGASLHTLRHSHTSHLLADGVDIATVSERLGHSSVRVTAEIYSHALRGKDDEAARVGAVPAATRWLAR
jgi:integrase